MRTKHLSNIKKVNQNQKSNLRPISCLGFLLGFNMALAFDPSQALALEIGYSGRLQEESGKSIDGPLDFTVKFFNVESGGDTVGPVLKLSNTELRDGVFQLSLNFDNGQLASIFGDGSKAAFVEVEAGGKVYPRQRLIAVPLALRVPVDTSTLNYTNEGKLTVESVDISKISGLTAALAAKANASTNLSDLSSPATARTNLGLGTLATASSVTSSMIASNTIVDSNISSSAAIADTKLATISTAGKVSGSAITSGTIGGTTAINSSGAITTTGAVTATGAITGTGNIVVNGTGTATTELRFNDNDNSNYVGFKSSATVGTNKIWTLPAADGTVGQFLRTDGSGTLNWASPAGSGDMLASANLSDLANAGTARTNLGLGTLATNSAVTSALITDGTIVDGDINASAAIADTKLATISTAGKVSGSAITSGTIGGTTVVATSGQLSSTGNIRVSGTGITATELRFGDNDDSNHVGFKAPATVGTNLIWTLPATDGTANQALSTNASGVLQWVTPMLASDNLSGLGNVGTARTNLGLGALATEAAVTSALVTDGTIVDADINASAAIADTKLATISTAGKVSGSAITSGTIAGSTIFNTTGAITTSAAITGTGNFIVNGTGAATTELRFNDDNNSNYVGFKAPGTVGTNRIWTLPAADGTNGQLLRTDGSGALSWVSPGGVGDLLASNNLSDLANAGTARTNLGLGTLATNSAVTSALITNDTIVDADINSAAAIADTKLATISTAGKVSGSAITSGTIAGSTIFNTTGAVTTSAAITGQNIIVNATGAAATELRFNDDNNSNYVGFKAPGTVATNRIWTLPAADGTNGQLLRTDGSGALSWVSAGGGGDLLASNNLSDLANAGTARTNLGLGTLATNSAVTSALITNDTIVDADINSAAAIADTKLATISTAGKVSGSAITSGTIGGSTVVATSGQLSSTGNIRVSGTGITATELRFGDNDDSNYVGFKSPATVGTNLIWTLPAADGTANQALSTNASGVLQWVTPMLGSNNLSDLGNASTARTNLGLGSLATGSAVTSALITDDTIVNADINASAAIATSKLSGAVTSIASHGLGGLATLSAIGSSEITNDSIMNADINTSAAIATSKLSGAVTSIASHGLGGLATLSAVGSSEITNDSIMDADINSAAAIADTKLATISTAGKVSGSAITSGTIAGSTVFNTSGAVTTSAAITGQNVIVNSTGAAATELRFNDDNNSNYVGFKAPGTVGTNLVWTLPAADGTANQALSTNASGVLQWVTPLLASNNLSDLANAGTARTNLGLGTLATVSAVGSSEITNDSIMNADINTSAAIATSKLSGAVTSIASHGLGSLATLSAVGSTEITNGAIMDTDVNASAAIATSKLSGAVTSIASHGLGSLATLSAVTSALITNDTIVDADINSAAAIADTKLATISTAGKVSGSAITSGTIAGTTAINSSGAITTTGAVTGKTFVAPPATTMTPSGTTQTIDFSTSNVQTLDLENATGTVTLTFNNAVSGGVYTVIVDQGATPRNITWPAEVKWESATAPTLSGANAIDIITFLYKGTNYFGVSALTY